MYRYKSLNEQLAGYYQLGDEFYTLIDFDNPHFAYTTIHERTHANLGSATLFGIFQKIIYRIKYELINQKTIEYFDFLVDSTIKNVVTVHESAATFNQFSIARHDKYKGLNEMFESLPKEYKDWNGIYEMLFNDSKIPYRAQGWIAYHLSRVSMETNILDDFKKLIPPTPEIEKYFQTKNNNPNERQLMIIDFLMNEKIELVFMNYLNYYNIIKNKLDELYLNRSIRNRAQSLQFQNELRDICDRIFDQILFKIGLTCTRIDSSIRADSGNELIEKWKYQLIESKSINSLNYKIISTDNLDVDPLELAEIIIPPKNQLSGLVRIENTPIDLDIYVARIWIHKSDIPFKLSDHLQLHKGNLYIRYYGFHNRKIVYYNLTDNSSAISILIKDPVISILCDGIDYELIRKFNFHTFNGSIIYYWQKFEEIPKDVFIGKKIKMSLYSHSNFSIALFQNNIPSIYHLYFFTGNTFIEQLKDQSEQILFIDEKNEVLSQIMDIILNNFNHIF